MNENLKPGRLDIKEKRNAGINFDEHHRSCLSKFQQSSLKDEPSNPPFGLVVPYTSPDEANGQIEIFDTHLRPSPQPPPAKQFDSALQNGIDLSRYSYTSVMDNEAKTSNGISMHGDVSASKDKTADILYNYLKIAQDAPILGKPTIFAADTMGSSCLATQELTAKPLENLLLQCNPDASKKMKAVKPEPENVDALEGVDTLANLAILGEGDALPASSQVTTKHP
ncbi:hypothetical protein F3Y22_tig00117000pilonHSYRG00313 [Hibiscus syriacus]|uniref:Uncharacterized protein n=1 Tax=Hibiscus syriacus TaxID=106335 RepID=A0A6A2WDR6_HIBSY|nr:hypothetical protein F3Y22_tig00117000pilonHSYRG00313 [Hibiscus syriacus]